MGVLPLPFLFHSFMALEALQNSALVVFDYRCMGQAFRLAGQDIYIYGDLAGGWEGLGSGKTALFGRLFCSTRFAIDTEY